ncbi:MAG: hypothetical protein LBJ43_06150 [Propionibacteriaceae bacterium]|nr:hypothetical protein [Propionibacteriaceae bacterium]
MLLQLLSHRRDFAIGYRGVSLCFSVGSILSALGAFSGELIPVVLLTYTMQTVGLAVVYFAVLLVRTVTSKNAKSYGFYPCFSAHMTLPIMVSMFTIWCILALADIDELGFVSLHDAGTVPILSVQSLFVRLLVPLLMLGDWVIFQERGKLNKKDIWLCVVVPCAYLFEATALGLTHSVRYDAVGVHSYYFYSCLDADQFDLRAFLTIIGFILLFIVLMALWRFVDGKLANTASIKPRMADSFHSSRFSSVNISYKEVALLLLAQLAVFAILYALSRTVLKDIYLFNWTARHRYWNAWILVVVFSAFRKPILSFAVTIGNIVGIVLGQVLGDYIKMRRIQLITDDMDEATKWGLRTNYGVFIWLVTILTFLVIGTRISIIINTRSATVENHLDDIGNHNTP